jgi:hypothetical protein
VTPTEKYVRALARLKAGDLGLIRTHAGHRLDETLHGFDVFTGLYWPIREKTPRVPRREVAWLIAKLYAFRPLDYSRGATLPLGLRRRRPRGGEGRQRFDKKFDELLTLPLSGVEPPLRWALDQIADNAGGLDWVQLTDDLSRWEQEDKRIKWAEQYLGINE